MKPIKSLKRAEMSTEVDIEPTGNLFPAEVGVNASGCLDWWLTLLDVEQLTACTPFPFCDPQNAHSALCVQERKQRERVREREGRCSSPCARRPSTQRPAPCASAAAASWYVYTCVYCAQCPWSDDVTKHLYECVSVCVLQRAVLVPVLSAIGSKVVIAQTRGHDFVDACTNANGSYEVDVYRPDGSKQTDVIHVEAVGSLGNAEGRAAFMELPSKLPALKYIGFAVTDAGVAKDTQAIKDLAEFLYRCFQAIPGTMHMLHSTLRLHSRIWN